MLYLKYVYIYRLRKYENKYYKVLTFEPISEMTDSILRQFEI